MREREKEIGKTNRDKPSRSLDTASSSPAGSLFPESLLLGPPPGGQTLPVGEREEEVKDEGHNLDELEAGGVDPEDSFRLWFGASLVDIIVVFIYIFVLFFI